jgi:hypothetical protein
MERTSGTTTRRAFVGAAATWMLGGAIAAHAGDDGIPRDAPVGAGDVAILDAMLAVEHATLAACRHAAACGLLGPAAQETVARFAADHRTHRELLVATIRKLGAVPRPVRPQAPAAVLVREADALDLVAHHEHVATASCLRMLPALRDRSLATVAARIACDEAMHWTLANAALGRPAPRAALSFGA